MRQTGWTALALVLGAVVGVSWIGHDGMGQTGSQAHGHEPGGVGHGQERHTEESVHGPFRTVSLHVRGMT